MDGARRICLLMEKTPTNYVTNGHAYVFVYGKESEWFWHISTPISAVRYLPQSRSL